MNAAEIDTRDRIALAGQCCERACVREAGDDVHREHARDTARYWSEVAFRESARLVRMRNACGGAA